MVVINEYKALKYTVFPTDWGYFGLLGTKKHLIRTHLPTQNRQKVTEKLLKDLAPARHDPKYMPNLQKAITAYYKGCYSDNFAKIPVDFANLPPFTIAVLKACRHIKPGQTASYSQLAKLAGSPKAARAVGGALARNPIPLIIPCHRVIRADGDLSGFSATGGVKTKRRMLNLEKK